LNEKGTERPHTLLGWCRDLATRGVLCVCIRCACCEWRTVRDHSAAALSLAEGGVCILQCPWPAWQHVMLGLPAVADEICGRMTGTIRDIERACPCIFLLTNKHASFSLAHLLWDICMTIPLSSREGKCKPLPSRVSVSRNQLQLYLNPAL
jgi:hypothetical protein